MVVAPGGRPLAFANVESLVVTFLRARAELAGVAVGVTLPGGFDGTSPAVTVTRVGGSFADDDLLDRALVRVDTYSRDKVAALDLAGVVRGVLRVMPTVRHANGTVVADVNEERGPSWLRDPALAQVSRYTTRYHLLVQVHPRSDVPDTTG